MTSHDPATHGNDSSSISAGPVTKRRVTAASPRGVASLTPEQLAKKRANDREAQRAIRERTKNQIENLERRIRELESQDPYQELQAALRQKHAVQSENEEIRRRLTSVLSIIQSVIRAQGLNDLATAAEQDVRSGPTPSHSEIARQSEPTQSPNGIVPPEHHPSQPRLSSAIDRQRNDILHGLAMNGSGERLGFNFLVTRRPDSGEAISLEDYSQQAYSAISTPRISTPDQNVPYWAAPPRNMAATCPLDNILLEFVRSRQFEAAGGVSGDQLAGPAIPRVASFLNPEKGRYSHPLSKVLTDILSKFPGISGLPEQVAVLYVMFLILRWQTHPSKANYDRLPEWVSPRASQLFEPHPAWIDYLPWPKMRDKLVSCYEQYPFENWSVPYTTTLSLNWPYEHVDCLLSTTDSDELIINPVFERHLRKLENWSLGPAFANAHPLMADTARIKPE